ncbi:MAG: 16S rRNA (guanine(527)-N(7))-methyltransferase RsmG [Pseudomonadales bacterium]|nr:MAG: 16S rRNA (guanine(527)-N(7))-methyltransferase RsmG [Pseudomonadales bacterium]
MLCEAVTQLKIELNATQHWQLLRYLDTLLFWNKTYNLTAITQPTEALVKHLIDCLAILPTLAKLDAINNNDGQQHKLATTDMLDIGAGAGLPSVVVAICQPNRVCTPLDSNQKKIRFIRQVSVELGLANVKPVASRIEQFSGQFGLITSRAFASLQDFIELATPYLVDDGQLLAMKGKAPTEEELKLLAETWQIEVLPITVPYLSDSRHLVRLARQVHC